MVENFDGGMCNRFLIFDPTSDFTLQMELQAAPNNNEWHMQNMNYTPSAFELDFRHSNGLDISFDDC